VSLITHNYTRKTYKNIHTTRNTNTSTCAEIQLAVKTLALKSLS